MWYIGLAVKQKKISEKSIMSVMTFVALVHHDSPTITMNSVLGISELDTSNNFMLNIYINLYTYVIQDIGS